uniref:Uncharacterized protein n=1 Tax=Leersia perrieri TaxID=77586 RepID=A0A0D9VL90_9ORYZ
MEGALLPATHPAATPPATTQAAVPPSFPSSYVPGAWFLPGAQQSMSPSAAPYWLTGLHQSGIAGSSAEGSRWFPAGIGASASAAPNPEHPDLQALILLSWVDCYRCYIELHALPMPKASSKLIA